MNILLVVLPTIITILGIFCYFHFLMKRGKIVVILISFIVILMSFVVYTFFFNTGEVTGVFVKGETQDYGELCGQYPETYLVITNFTINADRIKPSYNGNSFYFDNYYPDIDKLVSGHIYRIEYSKGGRSADSDASQCITEYYIDNISEVK